jgi:hypothetical protein
MSHNSRARLYAIATEQDHMDKKRIFHILLVTTGFMLSPLTWWNDLVINVPLAYLISLPFSLLHEQLFLPAFVLGYWFTNLAGFLLMHWGGRGLLHKHQPLTLRHSLVVSIIYTGVIVVMVVLGWLQPPSVYLEMFLE